MSLKRTLFDSTDFEKKFADLVKNTIPELLEEGLEGAINKLKLDCDDIQPRTPHGKGDLKSDVEFQVKRKLKEIVAALIFKKPYAAYQHRGERYDGTHKIRPYPVGYKETGSGANFLTEKLANRGDIYMKKVEEEILKGGGK
jgi:hypothetical protein